MALTCGDTTNIKIARKLPLGRRTRPALGGGEGGGGGSEGGGNLADVAFGRHPDRRLAARLRRYPWADWHRGWVVIGRDLDEFWRLSPGQVIAVLNAHTTPAKRRGSTSELLRLARAAKGR
jgi:hypothetical protein